MSTKHGFMPVSVSRIPIIVQSISRLAFLPFLKGLHQLCVWLAKYNCNDVCMESTGKYWILFFNILEQHKIQVTPIPSEIHQTHERKQDRPQRCQMDHMCGMVKPSFIPPAETSENSRDLVRYRFKLTCMITGEKNRAQNCLTVSNLEAWWCLFLMYSEIFPFHYGTDFCSTLGKNLMCHPLLTAAVKLNRRNSGGRLMVISRKNRM